jgi:hypothetical protein
MNKLSLALVILIALFIGVIAANAQVQTSRPFLFDHPIF